MIMTIRDDPPCPRRLFVPGRDIDAAGNDIGGVRREVLFGLISTGDLESEFQIPQ